MNTIKKALYNDLPGIRSLLRDNDLPFEDITQGKIEHFEISVNGASLNGTVGLEVYKKNALLRSLAIKKVQQNSGIGSILVKSILRYALEKGINKVYLLTNTAEMYFRKKGFITISRLDVPQEITETEEFASLCPASAVCMMNIIS